MKQTKIPKYANLQYSVLHELDININEYFLLDMIYHLSGSGVYWCNKKLENIAYDMRLSKRGVTVMRDRLIERKLILKGVGNRLKTSEKVQKVYLFDESELTKSALSSKKVHKVHSKSALNVAKTTVENNYRITKEYNKKKSLSEIYMDKYFSKRPSDMPDLGVDYARKA